MSHELLDRTREDETARAKAWEACRFAIGGDRAVFETNYVGSFATRAAFGEHLLSEDGAAARHLARLPRWLGDYVQLDGNKCADDMERDGHFQIIAAEDSVYVFDRLSWATTET